MLAIIKVYVQNDQRCIQKSSQVMLHSELDKFSCNGGKKKEEEKGGAMVGVVAVTERNADGRPCLDSAAGETLHSLQTGVGIVLGDGLLQQPGTLYITTKRLIWLSESDLRGYAVDFLSLSMHAISRDPEAYPTPCIYTQIEADDDYEYGDEDGEEIAESDNHEVGDLSKIQEMRLVPSDASVLDNLFQVLCDCAVLNPDPDGEAEGEADWFFNEDEVLAGAIGQSNGVKDHDITDLSELHIDDERFDDADELEGKNGNS